MHPSQMYALAVLGRADDTRRRAEQQRCQTHVSARPAQVRQRRRVLASLVRIPAADER